MRIQPGDERGIVEVGVSAEYQVHFFENDGGEGWATEVVEIDQAGVLEVIHWAQEQAAASKKEFAVALATGPAPARSVTWIHGWDLNATATDELESQFLQEAINPRYTVSEIVK